MEGQNDHPKMDEKEKGRLFLDRLLKHQEQTKDKKFYAIRRIDLLVITISGAGIYIILEMIKFFYGQDSVPDFCGPKIALGSFTMAIILNFVSQWTGYEANKNEDKSTEICISQEKGGTIDKYKLSLLEDKTDRYNILTTWFNVGATLLMLVPSDRTTLVSS